MAILTFTGTTTGTFSVASNWSPAQVPTLGDICIFTSSSPTCSLITLGTCSQVDFTNYNKRISFSTNTLVVYGNITLGNQMSFTFSTAALYSGYNFIMASTGSLTTNGMTMGVPFGFYNQGSSNTYTLNSNLICGEAFSTQANSGGLTHTINGFTISCYKAVGVNIGSNSSATLTTGTTNIIMLGAAQTITSGAANNFGLANNFTINSTGIVTFSGVFYYQGGIFTYLRGSIPASSTLNFTGASTFDPSGTSASNIINLNIRGTGAITINSNFHTSNGVATQVAGGLTLNNNNVYIYSGSLLASTGVLSGTTTLIVTGTSSTSTVNISTSQQISNPIVINSPGIITLTQLIVGGGVGSVTYTAGNVNIVGQFTINLGVGLTYTLATNGVTFGTTNLSSSSGNLSLTNLFSSNIFNINNTGAIFGLTGNAGFNVNTLSNNGTLKLKEGLTYTTNTNIVCYTPGSTNKFSSWATNSIAYLNHKGASQSLYGMTVIDIDSSGGNTLWVYRPVSLTNTTNWNTLTIANLQSSNINMS